ncbi:MAG: HAD family hydrolase, partial [Actinomadura sp.]
MRDNGSAKEVNLMEHPAIPLDRIGAVIFDTDGVITDTAQAHAAAWKTVFDSFLRGWAAGVGEAFLLFDVRTDYLRYVAGRPRQDAIRDFLASRHIHLRGDDPAVRDIARRKDALFLDQIRRYGTAPFPAAVRLIHELHRRGVRTAAVSASRNCAEVLNRAGVAGMFD